MLEWVEHLLREGVELVFKTSLRVTRDQLNRVRRVTDLLLVGLFVLVQEISELLVVSELLFLHWNNLLDVALEVFQMFHEDLLLFNVFRDFGVVLSNLTLRYIDIGDLDICHVPFEDKVG